jgi:hypothetical protein
MDQACILCDHPRIGHFGTGCHRNSFLRGSCDCDFVEPPIMSPSATAEQHRERAAWWARRVDATDREMARGGQSSDRWLRLDRFRRAAEAERRRHLETAHLLEAAADLVPEPQEPGDDILDLICIESIAAQTAETLEVLLEHLDQIDPVTRDSVRMRLETEFDSLEPRRRRALLEDAELRGFLEHVGVVSPLDLGGTARTPGGRERSSASAERLARALDVAMRATLATQPFEEALAREFADTFGDAFWAQTHAEGDGPARDEAFLARYRTMRAQLETYWRHWASAPNPDVQHAVLIQHPAAFQRQMRLAIQVLTPIEKARFEDRSSLFGWVVSGMQPLFVDDAPVPLTDIVEARYITPPD